MFLFRTVSLLWPNAIPVLEKILEWNFVLRTCYQHYINMEEPDELGIVCVSLVKPLIVSNFLD